MNPAARRTNKSVAVLENFQLALVPGLDLLTVC